MFALDLLHIGWRIALFGVALLLVPILILRNRQHRRAQALRPGSDVQEIAYAFPERALDWFRRESCWILDPADRQPDVQYLGPILLRRRGEPIDLRVYGILPDCTQSIEDLRNHLAGVGTA